eukprot:UN22412
MELSGQINTTTASTTTTTWISNGTGGHINNNNTVGNFHFEPPDDSELLILQSIQLFFQIINVLFHSMGVTFLWALYERTEHKVQYIYLISLSGCELIINILTSVQCILELIGHSYTHNQAELHNLQSAIDIIYLICATGFSLVFFVTMIYITLDRMLDIYLNIRYHVYWNPHRALILIKSTWCVGLLVSVASV